MFFQRNGQAKPVRVELSISAHMAPRVTFDKFNSWFSDFKIAKGFSLHVEKKITPLPLTVLIRGSRLLQWLLLLLITVSLQIFPWLLLIIQISSHISNLRGSSLVANWATEVSLSYSITLCFFIVLFITVITSFFLCIVFLFLLPLECQLLEGRITFPILPRLVSGM